MKFVYPNIATTTGLAGVPNANFPIGNLNDEHTTKIWKASAIGTETLTGTAIGVCDTICLFGLSAESVVIDVYSDVGRTVLVDSKTQDTLLLDEFSLNGVSDRYLSNVWFEFAETSNIYYTITLNGGSSTASLGLVVAGKGHTYPNPNYGFDNDIVDHGLVKQLRNGAKFTRAKVVTDVLSGTLEIPVSINGRDAFWALRHFCRRVRNNQPFAILYFSGMTDDSSASQDNDYCKWVTFTSFKATEGAYSHSTINLTLEEYV